MRSEIDMVVGSREGVPKARPPEIRPAVRHWARQLVRALLPLAPPTPGQLAQRRALVLFLDGVGRGVLRRAGSEGSIPFLASLRDGPSHREAPTFSGMPSTTTAFQAGLFFGLRHPDIPAFGWLDRSAGELLRMNAPGDAARMEATLRREAGPGLFSGGTSYLSVLAGGSEGALSTAGFGSFRERLGALSGRWSERTAPMPAGTRPAAGWHHLSRETPEGGVEEGETGDGGSLRAKAVLGAQTAASLGFRLALETPAFLAKMALFSHWFGSRRHELGFVLNHFGVGTVVSEVAKSSAILDLVRGVPRTFLCLHEFDEHAHRRGPREALQVLPRIDRAVEALFAIAQEVPNPPEIWVITDHGHIPSIPFERIFGCTLEDWLAGAHDRGQPSLPRSILTRFGAPAEREAAAPPRVIPCGNYAHVYLGGDEAWDARRIARHRPALLARALDCPGVGLVAMRDGDGAVAFHGAREVDPRGPETLPKGVSPQAVRPLLEELARSPAAGDLLLFGSWFDDASIAFSWELSSHGGPSPEETETFVLHPAGIDPGRIGHGADLHRVLRSLYAPSPV